MAGWNKRRLLLLRWSIISLLVAAATIAFALVNRSPSDEAVLPGQRVEGLTSVLSREGNTDAGPIRFVEVTASSGIDFRHFPAERSSLLPEDMSSGVAVGDYDGDGRDDLYFVNFAGPALPGATIDPRAGRSRLYRNMGGMRFEDVTDEAGVGDVGFGMGGAWGDFDGDGDLDLYVTAYGPNKLFENMGGGVFRDVTNRAGVSDSRFSAGASWSDFDRDGDVDLYVCNYVDFVFRPSDRNAVKRQYATEQPFTLNPSAYSPVPNALFRNNGDGTFTDVAEAAGVADPQGRGLSASWVDFDNDGDPDLYVANDVSNNGVFRNRGDGTFEDIGAPSLAADYRGAMGIAIADFDDDLDLDLLITHWIAQENALFRNMLLDKLAGPTPSTRAWFMDQADEYGLGQISLDMVGWATGFCDFDNDGRRDLWIIDGSTLESADDHRKLEPQHSFIFRSLGADGFADVTATASPALMRPFVGRGGAAGDFDGDGLVDLVVVVHGGTPKLLKNTSDPTGHRLRVRCRATGGNTQALGTRVYVTAGDRTQMGEVGSGSSYLSQNEPTLHFGLGDADVVTELRIVWPDGDVETHEHVAVDRVATFVHTLTARSD